MTPHLRRLTTAVALLLTLVGLLAFGVGRVTRPSEREAKALRSMTELAAFRAADRKAFVRAKESGYAAGLTNGRAAGRRAGEARGEAMRETTYAAAASAHPHVHSTPTGGAEDGCCATSAYPDGSQQQTYASQESTSGDADSSEGTSTNGDGDPADHSHSSSSSGHAHTDGSDTPTTDTAAAASDAPAATAQRPDSSASPANAEMALLEPPTARGEASAHARGGGRPKQGRLTR